VDGIVLQEVVYCSYDGKKKAIKGRKTIITLTSEGLSFREVEVF